MLISPKAATCFQLLRKHTLGQVISTGLIVPALIGRQTREDSYFKNDQSLP